MKIVPDAVEQQINRVDPPVARIIGIICAVLAGLCALRLLWMLYALVALSSVGWFSPGLVVGLVVTVIFGLIFLIAAVGFINRSRNPQPPQ